jgi:hypothetical protein
MDLKDKIFIPIFILVLFTSILLLGFTMTGKFAYVEQTMKCGEGDCFVICRYQDDCLSGEICCEDDGVGVCKESSECKDTFEFVEGEKIIKTNNMRYPTQEGDTTNILTVMVFIIILGVIYLMSRKHHKKHFSKSKRKKNK